MFAAILLAACAAIVPALAGDVTPTLPAPGDTFTQGGSCHIAWAPDTSGVWKTMNIELMTGNNIDMVHLSTVATVDGTDTTKTTFDYPCLSVTPNSAIYFYQFTTPASADKEWTGRFTIADASGNTTPPSNATQPDGTAIPWGTGQLQNPSQGVPAPGGASNSVSASGSGGLTLVPVSSSSAPASLSSSAPSAPPTALPSRIVTSLTGSATSTDSSSASSTSPASSQSTNAAVPLTTRSAHTLAALGAALLFLCVL